MGYWEGEGRSDEWYTPKYIFDLMGVKFDMDVAAPENRDHCNVPAVRYIVKNSLEEEWKGFCWMNPPFGGRNGIIPWLEKLSIHGSGIALTPDRTSAPWWQCYANKADAVLFVDGKVKFIKPDGTKGDAPSNGTTLMAFGATAVGALENAAKKGLGMLMVKHR